jgi:uncharacterized RDD family membrane protein YckC
VLDAPSAPVVPRGIVTPEAVLLEFETAGVGSRVLAVLVDLLIQSMAVFAFLMAFSATAVGAGDALPGWLLVVLLVLVLFVLLFGYWIGFEAWYGGRTPGKAVLGLRVVTVEGAPVAVRHAAIRGMFRLVDFYFTSGVVGILTATLSRRSQRLGDQFAGTIVLRERSGGTSLGALTFPPPTGYEEFVARLDVARLTEEQYGVVRGFLARVFQVTPAARAALASRLAARVVESTGQPVPSAMHPEVYLACVASAYQRRHPRNLTTLAGAAPPVAPPVAPSLAPTVAPPPPPLPPNLGQSSRLPGTSTEISGGAPRSL